MKFLTFLGIIFSFLSSQAQEELKITIDEESFNPGLNKVEISFYSPLLGGMGGKAGGAGGTFLGSNAGPESLTWNPAQVGLIKRPMVTIDTSFLPLGISVTRVFEEYTFYGQPLPKNPEVTFSGKQKIGIYGLAVACPVADILTVGFLWEKPFLAELEIGCNNFTAKVTAEQGVDTVVLEGDFSCNSKAMMKMDVIRFGGGKEITPGIAVGIGINCYQGLASFDLRSIFNISGTLNGTDPIRFNVEQGNELALTVEAEYQKSAWGISLGGSFSPEETPWQFDLAYNHFPTVVLEGQLESVIKEPKFLKEKEIRADEITVTVESGGVSKDPLILTLPSTLNLGVSYEGAFFTFGVNLIKYTTPFSFSHVGADAESKTEDDLNLKISPHLSLRLGLDFKFLRLGGGFTILEANPSESQLLLKVLKADKGNSSDKKMVLALPLVSLGYTINITPQLALDGILLGFPQGTFLKTSFVYTF
jgi:hypothetical protein